MLKFWKKFEKNFVCSKDEFLNSSSRSDLKIFFITMWNFGLGLGPRNFENLVWLSTWRTFEILETLKLSLHFGLSHMIWVIWYGSCGMSHPKCNFGDKGELGSVHKKKQKEWRRKVAFEDKIGLWLSSFWNWACK